ncbi:hypothetical protein CAEBREN_19119 [Caenorhabditis brenneri]|uniref:Uncharacterized protein n=1 Tax=Caenorhabditis brenneri TaxID=135651 RepID=G0MFR6_CAEBE|nr:hypothetical protein CAEBREN_19119 [Caenorhabditis brenneri]
MSDLKEERRKAKEQDKNYLEFRVQEILHENKPRNKATNLKKFDDEFPKPKKKNKEMEFGELMHKYLILRPDGRFATWQGKLASKKKKQKPGVAEGKTGLMHKMASAAGVSTKQSKDAPPAPTRKVVKNYDNAVKKALIQQADEEDGRPSAKVVPEDEEEAYVDAEMLSNYCSNPSAGGFIHNPVERKSFFIWGPTPQLWNEMTHFQDKKLIIGNTLKSILESAADRRGIPKERVDKGHKPILKWCKKTRAIEYVMDSMPLEKTAIYEEKLQTVFKQKENQKKE